MNGFGTVPVLVDDGFGRGGMDVPADWAQCGRGAMTAFGREEAVGREEEFAALVERQARFVYRVAYSVVKNAEDAEDVVREAFLKLHRTGAWRGMEEERAYLARVVWRIAVDVCGLGWRIGRGCGCGRFGCVVAGKAGGAGSGSRWLGCEQSRGSVTWARIALRG